MLQIRLNIPRKVLLLLKEFVLYPGVGLQKTGFILPLRGLLDHVLQVMVGEKVAVVEHVLFNGDLSRCIQSVSLDLH